MNFKFPMKPVRVTETILEKIRPEDYIHEDKYDGHRSMLVSEEREVKLFTRMKVSIPVPNNLQSQLKSLNIPIGTILDGEIWTPSKRGSWASNRNIVCSLTFWDVISFGNENVSCRSLEERRTILEDIIGAGTENIKLVVQKPVTRECIEETRKIATKHRVTSNSSSGFIHGVVLKRKGSPRRDNPLRSVEHVDWMKIVFEL